MDNVLPESPVGPSRHHFLDRGFAILLASALFLGSFLLFQVQPLIAKSILPWFGGSPIVWNSCLIFFQAIYLLGYTYAHLMARLFGIRMQFLIHLGLMIVAAAFFSLQPGPGWAPEGNENPVLLIIHLLMAVTGLPVFVLTGTGMMIQVWYSRLYPARNPYRLYALTNFGSLLALLSYPFLIEPILSLSDQVKLWSSLFSAFLLLATCTAAWIFHQTNSGSPLPAPSRPGFPTAVASGSKPWRWMTWSACGVALFISVTNRLSLEVAAVPFLWVLPLSIYLLTFIMTFSGRRFYPRRTLLTVAFLMLPVLFQIGTENMDLARLLRINISTPAKLGLLIAILAVFCLVCHGELYRLRPSAGKLTGFYLFVAIGSSLGGILTTLVAPLVFPYFQELIVCALAVCGLALVDILKMPDGSFNSRRRRFGSRGLIIGFLVCTVFLVFRSGRMDEETILVERNYFGAIHVNRVNAQDPRHDRLVMRHGNTKHGAQYLSSPHHLSPTTYFSPFTGVGLSMTAYQQSLGSGQPMHVGVVGLGIGTMAAYARDNDRYRFYEIDPAVVRLATGKLLSGSESLGYSYIDSCQGNVEIVLGDARLKMEQELRKDGTGQKFDFLVLDAFSSSTLPVHLLTREAFTVYLNHLKDNGVIAMHISSDLFDLRPICYKLALENGFKACLIANKQRSLRDRPDISCDLSLFSSWCILYRDQAFFDKLMDVSVPFLESGEISGESATPDMVACFQSWTDDYSNLFGVLDP